MTTPVKLQSVKDAEPENWEERNRREVAEAQKAEDEEKRRRRIIKAHEESGVPLRHAACSLASFQIRSDSDRRVHAAVTHYLERFEETAKAGRCLILVGGIGTGKTHLGCSLIRALCDQGRRAAYVRFGDVVRRIRDTWRKESKETELDVLAWLRRQELLVLDEVGVQYGTDSERNHVFDVIDGRYMDVRPTVIISNCRPEELTTYLGERALDRLRENGGRMLKLHGSSFRSNGRDGE